MAEHFSTNQNRSSNHQLSEAQESQEPHNYATPSHAQQPVQRDPFVTSLRLSILQISQFGQTNGKET